MKSFYRIWCVGALAPLRRCRRSALAVLAALILLVLAIPSAEAAAPEMSLIVHAGPAAPTFSTDSQTLVAGIWTDASGRQPRAQLTLHVAGSVGPVRIMVRDTSGLADTAAIFFNGTPVAMIESFVVGVGEVVGDTVFEMILEAASDNIIKIIAFDTAIGGAPPKIETGIIIVDTVPPVIDTPLNLVQYGAAAFDSYHVLITLGATGAGVRDNGPNPLFRWHVSDDSQFLWSPNADSGLFAEEFIWIIPPAFIDPASGLATLHFIFEDDAENKSAIIPASIIIDLDSPIVAIAAIPDNRPVNAPVTVEATVMDTTAHLGLTVLFFARKDAGAETTLVVTPVGGALYRATVPATLVGATAGAVTLRVAATDTIGRTTTETRSFTVAPPVIAISDSTAPATFTVEDTVYVQGETGYILILASGDTVRLNDDLATDTLIEDSGVVTTALAVNVANLVTITRISPAGDSASYVRWFIRDTEPPAVSVTLIDIAPNIRSPRLQIVATDNFGLDVYKVSGDLDTTVEGQFVAPGTSDTVVRTISLTADSGLKIFTVTVRDRAGNLTETEIQTLYETGGIQVTVVETSTPIIFDTGQAPAPGDSPVIMISPVGETLVTMTAFRASGERDPGLHRDLFSRDDSDHDVDHRDDGSGERQLPIRQSPRRPQRHDQPRLRKRRRPDSARPDGARVPAGGFGRSQDRGERHLLPAGDSHRPADRARAPRQRESAAFLLPRLGLDLGEHPR